MAGEGARGEREGVVDHRDLRESSTCYEGVCPHACHVSECAMDIPSIFLCDDNVDVSGDVVSRTLGHPFR